MRKFIDFLLDNIAESFMKDPSTVVGDVIGICFNTNIDKYEVYQIIHGDFVSRSADKSKSIAFETLDFIILHEVDRIKHPHITKDGYMF